MHWKGMKLRQRWFAAAFRKAGRVNGASWDDGSLSCLCIGFGARVAFCCRDKHCRSSEMYRTRNRGCNGTAQRRARGVANISWRLPTRHKMTTSRQQAKHNDDRGVYYNDDDEPHGVGTVGNKRDMEGRQLSCTPSTFAWPLAGSSLRLLLQCLNVQHQEPWDSSVCCGWGAVGSEAGQQADGHIAPPLGPPPLTHLEM